MCATSQDLPSKLVCQRSNYPWLHNSATNYLISRPLLMMNVHISIPSKNVACHSPKLTSQMLGLQLKHGLIFFIIINFVTKLYNIHLTKFDSSRWIKYFYVVKYLLQVSVNDVKIRLNDFLRDLSDKMSYQLHRSWHTNMMDALDWRAEIQT